MKTFKEFILEVNRPEKGSDEEKARWDKVKASLDSMSDEDKSDRIIGTLGRDKGGDQRYGLKKKSSRNELPKRMDMNLSKLNKEL